MAEVFGRADAVVEERAGTDLLLVAPGGSVLRLAGTAVAVWEAWAAPADTEDVVAALCRRYRGDAERVRADVVRLRELLREHGLLTLR
ncbi:MAG: PqqD family protein [Mycobacteriales bacterium]